MVNIVDVLTELMSALAAADKNHYGLCICLLALAHGGVLATAPLQSTGSHTDVIGTDAKRAEGAER